MGASPYSTDYLRDQIIAISKELDREAQTILEIECQASDGWQTDKHEQRLRERSTVKDSLLKKLAVSMNALNSKHSTS